MKDLISGCDIICDICGHAEELKIIFQKMGYKLRNHVWTHAERKVLFVGYYIDRGPDMREIFYMVKRMVDAGQAVATMLSNEYNALSLAFAYHKPAGGQIDFNIFFQSCIT